MKKTIVVLLGVISLYSCSENVLEDAENEEKNIYQSKPSEGLFASAFKTDVEIAMRDFSVAFEKVIVTSPKLRSLIKAEALKKINNDTDVLVYMIKDKELESGTFEQIIDKELKLQGKSLQEILSLQPTISIYVPKLPEESFNAEKWNAESEIPALAIRLNSTNDIPIIWEDLNTEVLSYEDIPAFPVLVVKKNERIVSSLQSEYSDLNTAVFFEKDGVNFKFVDNVFDGIKNPLGPYLGELLDQDRLKEAYEIYKDIDGWQRDYIYYKIEPNNPNGPISYDYSEHIGVFTTDNAKSLYTKIADQTGDAKYNPHLCNGCKDNFTSWLDGQYEFKFLIRNNSTSGSGEVLYKRAIIQPEDLFNITYTHTVKKTLWWERNFFDFESISAKSVVLNLEMFDWDLRNKSVEIKISVFEEDDTEEQTIAGTFGSKFATNFSSDTKEGMKYGSSSEVSSSQTVNTKVTKSSDELGDVVVNFGHKFYINKLSSPLFFKSRYARRYYSTGTGLAKFTVEPRKVQ